MTKAFYDKSVPTKNLISTISGIVMLVISVLAGLGVFTPAQAEAATTHTTTLLTLAPDIIGAITGILAIFKMKDV
jgi:hypothetical protein